MNDMTVLFGAEPLLGPRTGIGRYSWELYLGLTGRYGLSVRLVANGRFVDGPRRLSVTTPGASRPPLFGLDNVRRLVRDVPGYEAFRTWSLRRHPGSAHRSARRFCRAPPPNVVYHEPNFVLRQFAGPAVTTVHDLAWKHQSDTLRPETRRIMERGMPKTLDRADHILTVSYFVADELVTQFGVSRDRITVTPNGVDRRFRVCDAAETAAVLSPLSLRHGEYLLVVGTPEPRKNLCTLIRAYAGLPVSLQRRFPLVLAGGHGWGTTLGPEADRLLALGRIRLLGYVSDEELPLLYAGAAGFAMPSLYEGFGMPILEAMASGVPTLTSTLGAMPEVSGGAALLIEPRDEASIRAGLQRLIEDAPLRKRLVADGLVRAASFDWSRTIAATLAVYRRVLVGCGVSRSTA